ncbi:MAG: hypothetical protein RR315_09045 [Oscillospiraceae bacterium]
MYRLARNILIFLLSVLIITGCGSKDKNKAVKILSLPMTEQSITLNVNDESFSGTLTKKENGDIAILLSSKELTIPISFSVTADKITVSQNNLKITKSAYLCPMVMLYNSFKALPNGEISSNGAYYTLSYDCFKCKIDMGKKKIIKITFPNTEVIFI